MIIKFTVLLIRTAFISECVICLIIFAIQFLVIYIKEIFLMEFTGKIFSLITMLIMMFRAAAVVTLRFNLFCSICNIFQMLINLLSKFSLFRQAWTLHCRVLFYLRNFTQIILIKWSLNHQVTLATIAMFQLKIYRDLKPEGLITAGKCLNEQAYPTLLPFNTTRGDRVAVCNGVGFAARGTPVIATH